MFQDERDQSRTHVEVMRDTRKLLVEAMREGETCMRPTTGMLHVRGARCAASGARVCKCEHERREKERWRGREKEREGEMEKEREGERRKEKERRRGREALAPPHPPIRPPAARPPAWVGARGGVAHS